MDGAAMKLLLVGPYPPPYGGIATTVQDLHRYLVAHRRAEVVVLNIGEGRKASEADCLAARNYGDYLRKVLDFAQRGYTIHLETNGHNLKSWLSALVCAAAGLRNGRGSVIAFGSGNLPDYVRQATGWRRLVIRAVVRWAGMLVCRNERMRLALFEAGADPGRIAIVPGFLGMGAARPAPVRSEIAAFLESHGPLLGVTAGLGPEYGLPLMLAALRQLRQRFPRVGLVIMGPGPEAGGQIEGYDAVREQVCLAGPIPHEEVLGVMTRLTLFVRPTLFDGDSNSVREALILGVPVVASRTDYRPPGVITFVTGDLEDLTRTLALVLEHPEEARRRLEAFQQPNGFEQMVRLYGTVTQRAA